MIKNKVLTPVLSCVLGASIVGSGLGYYFVNKDNKSEAQETMDTMKVSLTEVEQNVNTAVDEVQKAVSGQLDFAYDSDLKISFGDLSAANSGSANTYGISTSFQPIEISTKVKQKGQNSQAEIGAKYNGSTLITLETIYQRDAKKNYFRIPELSSSYISATEDEMKKAIEDYAKKYEDKIKANGGNIKISGKNSTTANNSANALEDFKNKLQNQFKMPDLNSVDSKKLEEKLKSYYELIKSKLPAQQTAANITGEIDGNKYDYKTVSYSISGKQAGDIINTVLDKMAADTDLKKLFDDFMAKQSDSVKKAAGTKSYADLIAEMKKNAAVPAENQNKVAKLDIYLDGEEPVGAALSYDNKTLAKAVIINKSDVNAIDASFADQNGKVNVTLKGSAKLTDGTINGKYVMQGKETGKDNFTCTLTLDKVVIKEKNFSGTVTAAIDSTSSTGKKTNGTVKISGTCTADKKDLKFSVDSNGKNIVKIDFTLNKTDATDVAIPTTNVFSIDKINDYWASCDLDNFKANINSALGFNLFGIVDSFKNITNSQTTKKSTTGTTPSTDIDMSDFQNFQLATIA